MPNRLAAESSPYLLQHADNPVDWYPWGDEAFASARADDRPVILSVGYSACHWCHVMAHESFENPEIAALMNELFVSIKVDREERPDIDTIYMSSAQAMGVHGGWPLTVFLTPEGLPYFAGTYFPPVDRQGMHGFGTVLRAAADAYHSQRPRSARWVSACATRWCLSTFPLPVSRLRQFSTRPQPHSSRPLDRAHGGFGAAPKFPHPQALDLLLRR